RREEYAVLLQVLGSLQGGGHVRALCHRDAAVLYQLLCILKMQLVLGRAGKAQVYLYAPYAASLMVLGIRTVVLVLGQAGSLHLFDLLEGRHVDAFRIVYPAVG